MGMAGEGRSFKEFVKFLLLPQWCSVWCLCICVCAFVWERGHSARTHSVLSRMAADVQGTVIGARDPAGPWDPLQSLPPSCAHTHTKAVPYAHFSFTIIDTHTPACLPPHLAWNHTSVHTNGTHTHPHILLDYKSAALHHLPPLPARSSFSPLPSLHHTYPTCKQYPPPPPKLPIV